MTLRNVLFVCRDNALLGPMAEACLNAAGRGRFRAFSAGREPAERLHPGVARLLAREGFDPAVFVPKSWQVFAQPHAPRVDTLIALGRDAFLDVRTHSFCDLPGAPLRLTWPADGAGLPQDAAAFPLPVAEIYQAIRLAVLAFLAGNDGSFKGWEDATRTPARPLLRAGAAASAA